MPVLRLLPPQILFWAWRLRQLPRSRSRWLHSRKPAREALPKQPQKQRLSLLEELFPEEVYKRNASNARYQRKTKRIPRLPLPKVDDVNGLYQDGRTQDRTRPSEIPTAAFSERDSFRQWKLAVLVMRRASKSLTENDFRRAAPKGRHIDDWKGPGDILKEVIPARDLSTLQQSGHYFLLFPNPAYARAYQAHVLTLHRIARTHTPTSIESPITPPEGMLVEGEDVYDILQNYALCPPSQRISLKILFPPYSPGLKRLMSQRGYSQIIGPNDKTEKAVLLWVNGYQPNLAMIRDVISRDGQDRGIAWALANGENSIEKAKVPLVAEDEIRRLEDAEDYQSSRSRPSYPRWIISFTDENEARRFTRTWHQRPFPLGGKTVAVGEPPPLVHAEVIW